MNYAIYEFELCADSNKARVQFEFNLQEALQRYQQVASDRVHLVQSNCKKLLESYKKFIDGFGNASLKFEQISTQIDSQKEVNKFVEVTTSKQKQVS